MAVAAVKTAKTINVIDIEASGFGRDSYPIEIGIALADGRQYQTLVRPEAGWQHWDRSAQDVHGISRSDLFKYGRSVFQICREINEICAGAVLYSDCWVYDHYWFRRLFDAAHTPALGQCKAMEYLLNDEQQLDYQTVKQTFASRLGLPMHRALNDAVVIQKTLQSLTGSYHENAGRMESLQPAIRSSQQTRQGLRIA